MATVTPSAPASTPREANPAPALQRKDQWWTGSLTFFILFSAFGMWATFRAFQNDLYEVGPYLSPFYSPTIKLGLHIGIYSISPALLILPFPLMFRLSCYYYRKAIYRAYLLDPAGCAVAEPTWLNKLRYKRYQGERAFPLIVQNLHRFAFYAAVIFIVLLWKDTAEAFFFPGANGTRHFGIHLGTLIFLGNILLLSAYTFSCHSWRHLIGGNLDCYSCSALNKTRYGLWNKVSFLNEQHGTYALLSMCSVGLTDVYVWLLASHHITDFTLLGT